MHEDLHTTVLLQEAITALVTNPSGTYVDGTFGRGGHSALILDSLDAHGRLLAYDKDPQAIACAQTRFANEQRFSIAHDSFDAIAALATDQPATADGILLDLGVSSPQINDGARGFSFMRDGPLDMRMDPTRGISVADWLRTATESEMTEVIDEYGEERFAKGIAKAIADSRDKRGPITRTLELAQIVAGAVKTRESGQNPATRTFQAFRIFINAELEALRRALDACIGLLKPGGRVVVISFHSLEDRIVKQWMLSHSRFVHDRRLPYAPDPPMRLHSVERIKPSAHEVSANPRSRSAVMRVATRSEVPT
jgi:16S rRNA (cytosine1402-N4)-methyltransferase